MGFATIRTHAYYTIVVVLCDHAQFPILANISIACSFRVTTSNNFYGVCCMLIIGHQCAVHYHCVHAHAHDWTPNVQLIVTQSDHVQKERLLT